MATRLEQIVKRAKELKKTAPASTKWTDLIKKASKQVTPVRARATNKAKAVRNLGLSGVKKKRSTKAGSHKDTRSHNVNIRVVSGVPDNYTFSVGEAKLYTQKQFTIFGKVELVVFEPKNKKTITLLDGKNTARGIFDIEKYILENNDKSFLYNSENWKPKIKKLVTLLNKEIAKYNKDIKAPKTVVKKATVKRAPVKKSVKKAPVKKSYVKKTRAQESEAIRQKVRKDGFIMPHGYAVKKAKNILNGIGIEKDMFKEYINTKELLVRIEKAINNTPILAKKYGYNKSQTNIALNKLKKYKKEQLEHLKEIKKFL